MANACVEPSASSATDRRYFFMFHPLISLFSCAHQRARPCSKYWKRLRFTQLFSKRIAMSVMQIPQSVTKTCSLVKTLANVLSHKRSLGGYKQNLVDSKFRRAEQDASAGQTAISLPFIDSFQLVKIRGILTTLGSEARMRPPPLPMSEWS